MKDAMAPTAARNRATAQKNWAGGLRLILLIIAAAALLGKRPSAKINTPSALFIRASGGRDRSVMDLPDVSTVISPLICLLSLVCVFEIQFMCLRCGDAFGIKRQMMRVSFFLLWLISRVPTYYLQGICLHQTAFFSHFVTEADQLNLNLGSVINWWTYKHLWELPFISKQFETFIKYKNMYR